MFLTPDFHPAPLQVDAPFLRPDFTVGPALVNGVIYLDESFASRTASGLAH